MITKVINKRWMAVCLSLVIFMTTMQFEGTIQVNGVNDVTTDSVLMTDITVKNDDGTEAVKENDTYFVKSEKPIMEVSNAENIKEIGYSTPDDSTEEIITPVELTDDGSYSLPNLDSDILYKIWITNNQDETFESFCIVFDATAPVFTSIDEKEIESDGDIADVYWISQDNVAIKANDGKNGSGVVLKYSNEPNYTTADKTFTYDEENDKYVLSGLDEGKTYYVWLCDKIGNYIENPIKIKFDVTPPQVNKITDVNNNNLFEKTKEDEKTYWTNQDTVRIYLDKSGEGTLNFKNSNTDSPKFLADKSDDEVICYEVELGSDNNYICVSDEAGNSTEIFVNKKLSVDYVVRRDEEYLVPNGGGGTLYTIHADILIIDVTGENMAGVGIESVEECVYVENSENDNYIEVEETGSNYNIKLDKENIIQVKITDKLGNISTIQLEYTDNDAGLVFYDNKDVSIFPDEENTYYFKDYYSFSLFNYSRKITNIHYLVFGDESSEISQEIDQIENTKFLLSDIANALKQNEKKFYELCFKIDTRGYKDEKKTEEYKIVYDSEAPKFTIVNNVEGKYVNSNTEECIELIDVKDDSGILKAEYFISEDQNENPEKYELSLSRDGKYKLNIYELTNKLKNGDNEINFILTDKAGNEEIKSTIIKYDDIAPTFTAQYSHDNETLGKTTDYVIEIKARDDMSKVEAIKCIINEGDRNKKKERVYLLEDNDKDEINYTISINDILNDLAEGSNTVKIVVIDKAGNENSIMDGTNEEAVYTIGKDTTPPEFNIQYKKDGEPFGKNTVEPIILNGISDASDITRITFIINKGQPEEKSFNYKYIKNKEYKFIPKDNINDFLEGNNIVTIEVEDAVGNIGSKAFNNVIRDTKEPVFEISYLGEGKPNGKDTKEKIDIMNISDASDVTGITCIINKGKETEKIFQPQYHGEENYTINIHEIMDVLSEGENTVQIEVTDEVDNIRSVIYNVRKDTTPPKFKFVFENNDKGFITKKTSAKITVKDISDISKVMTVTFIIKQDNTDGVNNSEVKYQYSYEKGKEYILDFQKNLEDLSEGNNTVRIEIRDEVDNIGVTEYTVKKDTIAPDITLTYNNKGYITNGTEAKVVIKNISDDISGVESITYYINGHKIKEEYSKNKDYSISLGDYLNNLSEGENKIEVIVKDKAENERSRTCTVKKDTKVPEAEFEYKYNNIYVNSDYNAQIIIRKVNDGLSGIKNVTYSVGSHSDTLTPKNGIYTLNINDLLLSREAILQQGKNKITFTISDNAGNSLVKNFNICIDTIKPEIGIPKFDETVKVEHEGNNYYIKEATTLFVPVLDEKELKSVVLIMGDKKEIRDVSGKTATAEFRIPAGFKGKLSVYVVDHVGNMSEQKDVGGTFIETAEMHNTYSAITFSKPATTLRDTAGNELYREERIPVTIDVTDNFSGIKQIEWKVSSADTEAAANENGYIIINGTELSGNLEQVSILDNDKKDNINEHIVTHLSKELFISDNSNNITLTVTLTDNAGNTSYNEIVFSNDTTPPVVTVTYDNNAPDAGNGQMFNRERTATIEVAERNFDPNRMIIDITNTDNVIPNITGWTLKPGTGNQDDTVYTTTITYSADGDYVFNMSFQDMAGHNAQINFGNSIAPQVFTVDKTKPILNIAYDNNDGNGAYYKDSRIATITIDEHNFSEDRLNLTVMKNGSNETPQSTGWSNNGDTHSMTLIFAEEAEYSIMVSYTDMAGNMADNTVNNSFFVDKSEPQVLLSGIENQKAYKSGQIGFEISGTDIYFDTLNVLLIRIDNFGNRTTINLNKAAIENGEKVSVDNLAQDGIYQLSYTATDKSARNVGETIIFSVNRNGSTYMLSDQVMKLNKSYVKSVDYDIVIKEINVNELLMDSVILTLSRGSSSKELKEGVDFTVQKNTGSEQWCEYVYIIKKSCFTEDGLYSLSISSKDISGNISVSDLEAKASELSFVVDKTSPICNVMNLKSGTTYATNSKRVEFTVSDNIMLSKVSVLLNGTELLNLTEETLRQIADNGENISFDIPNSDSVQTVVIQYADKAGNEGITELKDFYVTTNPWIRYTNNTPLMVSTIAGAVTVLGLAAFILMFRKKAGRH